VAIRPVTTQNFQGLFIQQNSFTVPEGGLEIANNVVISNDGIIRKRRGFSLLTAVSAMTSPIALTEYASTLLVAQNSLLSQVNRSTGGLTSLSGSLVAPSGEALRFAQAGKNLYATSAAGVRKIESLSNAIIPAGIPPGLDVSITSSGVAGVFPPNSQSGYRIVFGRKDANNNKVVGAPSELSTLSNSYINSAASYSGTPGTAITITSTAHGLANGTQVVIGTATDANLVGTWSVSAAAANTFVVTTTSSVATSGTCKFGVYRQPSVEFTIASGLSTEHFYQIYRTGFTEDVTVSPSDDGRLVFEANFTSGQIAAGLVTFTDDVEDLFLGADLYTNPNQGGIQSSNFEPPLCTDIALFKGSMFYANTESKHSLNVSLVSVQAADFPAASYIEITSGATTHRYVATATAPVSVPAVPNTSVSWNYGGVNASGHVYFLLTASTSTTVASAIAATAKSLCKAINRHSAGLVYAYYTSGPDDVPGAIRLVRRVFGSSFTVEANNATVGDAFSPELYNGGVGRASANSDEGNSVYFSKPQEHEAVPLPYQLLVGDKSSSIQRILPLRDSLLVLKSDGLWRIGGDGPSSFYTTLIDATIPCVASNSAATLANQVFFLSAQGVVAASETSAEVMSRPIEALLSPILSSAQAVTNATSYESERLYLLSTVQPGSVVADIVYVFNLVTRAWTTWDTTFTSALVSPTDDKLYMIDGSSELIKERKSQNQLDYCERSFSITCTMVDVDAQTAQFSGSATIDIRDIVIKVGSDNFHRVTSIDSNTTPPTITFDSPPSFEETDACVLYKPIRSQIKTAPMTLGDSTVWKQFSDVRLAFRNKSSASALTFGFQTDDKTSNDTEWEAASVLSGWGNNWGSEWGGQSIATVYTTQASQEARVYVPLDTSRGTFLQIAVTHEKAAESIELQALSVTARTFGHRVTR